MRSMLSRLARPRVLLVSLAVLSSTASGCGSDGDDTASDTTAVSGEVVVFAASSLTEAFTEIGTAFQSAHPEATVTFNFAGSGDLVGQIAQGAPADVFVSADDANMSKLVDAGVAEGEPLVIAKNTMEIIVAAGNPKGITGLADLADPDLITVLCADTVPCGKNAVEVLANAGVAVTPASLEDKVKGVVTKVTVGEADVGIVFVTDVEAAGNDAEGVEIPADVDVISNYPISLTTESTNPEAGQAFIDFVAGAEGQAILATFGFLRP